MARDAEIQSRLERVREIVEYLETPKCSRSEAEAHYEEGQGELREIREILDVDSGEIVEIR